MFISLGSVGICVFDKYTWTYIGAVTYDSDKDNLTQGTKLTKSNAS